MRDIYSYTRRDIVRITKRRLMRLIENVLNEETSEEWWVNWRSSQGTPEGKKKLIKRVKKQELPRMKERNPGPRMYEMQTALKMAEALKKAGENTLAKQLKDAITAAAKLRGQTIADVKAGKARQKTADDPSRRNPVAAAKAAQLKGPRELEDAPDSAVAKSANRKPGLFDDDDEEEFKFADGTGEEKSAQKGANVASTKGKAPKIGDIIKNKTQGNAFRTWVNETHPAYAKKADLDEKGSHTNKYITAAWNKFGKEFMESGVYKNVQVGNKKITFAQLGTKGMAENANRWQKLAGI